ncbi:hypothetical protein F511_41672 [Dorcoceras hygrometricum]|uniref:Uncharacterized protein n=1 Tax=Dorcoceras hygrometricum TaxID=472368 RepID=A0A2Z7A6V5_9LAMI|nr:hypothetical protein F511_41672 [Dorcoceras hygrometricum]
MAASFFINAMQVDFASVLAMEHTGMAKMFKSLEDTGLKGFLEASSSMFEGAVTELFANVKVIAGKIVSFVANRKMVITKDVFTEAFELPTEGLVGFLDILTETVVEMRFLGTDVPLRTLNKKKEMRMEYRLLHDIISKALFCFRLIAMVHSPRRQSQGFAMQLSVLLKQLVKADLGEAVKLHRQKVLKNKSVHTYMKKNLNVGPAGETSKISGATASEQQSTTDSVPSLTKKLEQEAGEMKKPEKAAVEKPRKKKEKIVQIVKK